MHLCGWDLNRWFCGTTILRSAHSGLRSCFPGRPFSTNWLVLGSFLFEHRVSLPLGLLTNNPSPRLQMLLRSRGVLRYPACECSLDQCPRGPFKRFQRLFARGSGNIFHHDNGVDAEQERERLRPLAGVSGILTPLRTTNFTFGGEDAKTDAIGS